MSYTCKIYCFGPSDNTSKVCQFKMFHEIVEIRLYLYAPKSYFNEQNKIPA